MLCWEKVKESAPDIWNVISSSREFGTQNNCSFFRTKYRGRALGTGAESCGMRRDQDLRLWSETLMFSQSWKKNANSKRFFLVVLRGAGVCPRTTDQILQVLHSTIVGICCPCLASGLDSAALGRPGNRSETLSKINLPRSQLPGRVGSYWPGQVVH